MPGSDAAISAAAIHTAGEFFARWEFLNIQFIIVAAMAAAYATGVARLLFRSEGTALPAIRIFYGVAGFAILIFATAGPVEAFSGEMFTAHMAQHILIAIAAAPLVLASSPMSAYMWALPETVRLGVGVTLTGHGAFRRALTLATRPRFTLPAFVITMWGWHIPQAYEASVTNDGIHFLMHVTMFVTALLFWWPIIGPAPVRSQLNYPRRLLYLILVVTPIAVLAAIITLSNSPIYTHYVDAPRHFSMTPVEDQRLGGLLMWIPGNIAYLSTMTALFFMWFAEEERKSRPRAVRSSPSPVSSDAGNSPETSE